jgi:RNA polymerase sigma factor for flagellar operon FliA
MYEKPRQSSFDSLVNDHADLVKRIAHHLMARLPDAVLLEDLVQAGMIGLIEAAKNYDASKGASFETYAGIRIRGSMLDEVRRGDWVPRSVHRNSRRVSDAIRTVESRHGRDARDAEVAEELGIPIDDYYHLLKDSQGSRLFSYEEIVEQRNGDDPEEFKDRNNAEPFEGMARKSLNESLVEAIKSLPEREQLVLSLYYDEELNLKEIGEVLGVSESRVSQIHSQAALRLRSRMWAWQEAKVD